MKEYSWKVATSLNEWVLVKSYNYNERVLVIRHNFSNCRKYIENVSNLPKGTTSCLVANWLRLLSPRDKH